MTIEHREVPEFFGQMWIRRFQVEGGIPEWFRGVLEEARPYLASGITDPLELGICGDEMTCIGPGRGRTLAYSIAHSRMLWDEDSARAIIGNLCLAIARIHTRGEVHGALTPLNIQKRENSALSLWSIPTARLELSVIKNDRIWELPFRSPQVQRAEGVKVQDDIFSLGKLLAVLVGVSTDELRAYKRLGLEPDFSNISDACKRVIETCTRKVRKKRYPNVVELFRAILPHAPEFKIDIRQGEKCEGQAFEAFAQSEFERAHEHWQDAGGHDLPCLRHRNNLAVCKMAIGDFESALHTLESAYRFYPCHFLVDCNIANCLIELGDSAAADFWLKRALKLKPTSSVPLKIRVRLQLARVVLGSSVQQICVSGFQEQGARPAFIGDK